MCVSGEGNGIVRVGTLRNQRSGCLAAALSRRDTINGGERWGRIAYVEGEMIDDASWRWGGECDRRGTKGPLFKA